MKIGDLTPGIVVSIDLLLRNGDEREANHLRRVNCIKYSNIKDRAVIDQLQRDGQIKMETVTFITTEGKSTELCEGCSDPATTHDSEGTPLCSTCAELGGES